MAFFFRCLRTFMGAPCASDRGRLPADEKCSYRGSAFLSLRGRPLVVSSGGGVLCGLGAYWVVPPLLVLFSCRLRTYMEVLCAFDHEHLPAGHKGFLDVITPLVVSPGGDVLRGPGSLYQMGVHPPRLPSPCLDEHPRSDCRQSASESRPHSHGPPPFLLARGSAPQTASHHCTELCVS